MDYLFTSMYQSGFTRTGYLKKETKKPLFGKPNSGKYLRQSLDKSRFTSYTRRAKTICSCEGADVPSISSLLQKVTGFRGPMPSCGQVVFVYVRILPQIVVIVKCYVVHTKSSIISQKPQEIVSWGFCIAKKCSITVLVI